MREEPGHGDELYDLQTHVSPGSALPRALELLTEAELESFHPVAGLAVDRKRVVRRSGPNGEVHATIAPVEYRNERSMVVTSPVEVFVKVLLSPSFRPG